MRRAFVTTVVLAAGLGGSVSAHLVGALTRAGAREAGESHGSIGWMPVVLASGAVLLVTMLVERRITGRRMAAWLAATPLVAFVLQEGLERLLSTESSPFEAGREPGLFGAGAALLPWILVAFLVGWAMVAVARAVASRTAAGYVLVPPPIGPEDVPPVAPVRAGRHDSILDRPPRAPPRP